MRRIHGVVGLSLFAVSFAVSVARAAVEARSAWTFGTVFPLVTLVFLGLFNISESTLLTRNTWFWILYVATAAQLGASRPRLRSARAEVPAEPALAGLVPDVQGLGTR